MPITIDEFFSQNNGQGLNVDGAFGNQCVDVFLAFNRDVVGGPLLSGNAIDYWTHYPTDRYDKIENTPEAIPQKGDVIIWNVGRFGHIAIFYSGDVNSFISFDQNWPSQGYYDVEGNFIGTGACHLQPHSNYSNVLGWLRPKLPVLQSTVVMPDYLLHLFNERGLDYADEGAVRAFWQKAIDFDGVKKNLDDANVSNTLLNNELAAQTTENKNLVTANSQLQDEVISLREDVANAPKPQNDPLPTPVPTPVLTPAKPSIWQRILAFLGY